MSEIKLSEQEQRNKLLNGFVIPVLDKGHVLLVDSYGTDSRIVEAARVSYRSPSKGEEQDRKLLNYLYKNRHTSPFEQCSVTYEIKLPLFVQGQIVRHRTQKLNQVSARYTEMPDVFYIPSEWRKQDTKNKQGSLESSDLNHLFHSKVVKEFCEHSYKLYKGLIGVGISKEMARMILPQNLYTQIYSCWDIHNLLHFFTLRISPHAQYEVRMYAQAMFDIFEKLYPWTAEAYKKYKIEMKETQRENQNG